MIKVVEIKKVGDGTQVLTLFADTKLEVPSTGAATAALVDGWDDYNAGGTISTGSNIYTPSFDIATLKSNDQWAWA